MPTCPSCGSALAAPLAPGDVCVLSPDGTAYEHRAGPPPAAKPATRWMSTAAELEAAPEPVFGEDAEVIAKPKRRGK